ncbi:reduced folate transporter [Cyclopterus lumpus]|uniref:Solute carrier family 19 member 1 n=1 Tax=Cyclopterus lumpus TaxID=8103 RepID=A0A8C2WKA4_CYCLU|nr:reduced folate transporter [Cyclopterus lumpus]XP_034405867.1 reduced folate transporter [Cyclopterus lumpus]XP_034405877.1 reduced folate transporter [Cyclopterus lumpus]XP_034405886.1 reduced folate transporter [Cyclopterus lumpus]XP_034405895.1 reduced folate transporter [Cyclopterus lumpus]XP_034405905.1 reduced folate transporter [Cyclopterus lumpus]XP_034405915.1 reduced folate transporter [Cyclopterus lumpus]XP_034405923.1 reduced folate transporter [Cyclopterus lumpus]XP_03440593
MVADRTAGSGDGSEGEKEMDQEAPASDEGRGHGDRDEETAVSASEGPAPSEGPPGEAAEPRKWKGAVMFLCFYGFMMSIKPGEPFITPYLLSPEKNLTREQVTNEITPVLTYSYMVVLVPAFLLTDLLRYKPVLIIQGVSQVVIWLILLLGSSLLEMQFMEFFYGITMACRVAYSSYIFSLVTPALYQRVAGYSRSAVLLGVFTSSVLGQLFISVGEVSFYTLNAISLGFVSFGLALSMCLPWPKRSLFFNRTRNQEQAASAVASTSELDKMNPKESASTPAASASRWRDSVFVQMLLEVGNVARRPNLRLWSLWWVFNSTGYYLVLFYVHILWNKVHPVTENKNVYNGGVEAASTLLSALTSFIAGYAKIRWNVWSELVIGVITALQAGLLLLMGTTDNIWVCYMAYVLFRGFYQFLVPIATFQIASSLTKELCALVFGINTFLGTVLKTIINLIFSDKRGLALDVHSQFLVYFVYFTILTVVYLVCAAVVIIRHYRNQRGGGGGGGGGGDSEQVASTELSPVAAESEPLSNGKSANAETTVST